MDTDELRDILDRLGWSQGELARRLGRNERGVRKMAQGTAPVGADVARWLRGIVTLVENPPPNRDREPAHATTAGDRLPAGR